MSVFLLALALSQESISADARLAKPTNIDAALMPIQTFLKNSSDSAGIVFSASPSIKNLKVDVFVDNKPLGETMAKLAEACDLQWSRNGEGYELSDNSSITAQHHAYMAAEDRLAQKLLNRNIAIDLEVARLVPASNTANAFLAHIDAYKAELKKAQQELQLARENKAPDDEIETKLVHESALAEICSGKPNLEMARLLSEMSPEDIEFYKSGLPYIASTSTNAEHMLSKGDLSGFAGTTDGMAYKEVFFTLVDPITKRIGWKRLTFSNSVRTIAGFVEGRYPFDTVPKELMEEPLMDSVQSWDDTKNLASHYPQPLNPVKGRQAEWQSQWFGNRFRLGDHLRWFHRTTGVPVIGPADRTTHPFVRLNRKADTQGAYLTSLLKECNGYSHKSGDFLLVRDGIYWRKQANEIPEEVYSIIESDPGVFYKNFTFAAMLNPIQSELVQDRQGFVLKVPRYAITQALPAMQFASKLSDEQLQAARSGGGIPYNALSPSQARLFSSAVIQGIADEGFISEPLLDELATSGYSTQSLNRMAFRMRGLKMTVKHEPFSMTDQGSLVVLIPAESMRMDTTHFEFGYNENSLISFIAEGG